MSYCKCEKRKCKCECNYYDKSPIDNILTKCEKVLFTGSYNTKNNIRKEDETTITKTLAMFISVNPEGYNPRLDVQYNLTDNLLPPNQLASETFSITSYSKSLTEKIGFIKFSTLYLEKILIDQKYGSFDVLTKSGIYNDVKRVIIFIKEEGEREVYFIGKY